MVLTESKGQYRIERCEHAMLLVLHGKPETDWFHEACLPNLEAGAGAGPFQLFIDVHEVRDFERGFRDAWVAWLTANHARVLRCVVFHNESVMVRIAMMAGKVALRGRLHGVTTRQAFAAELERTGCMAA